MPRKKAEKSKGKKARGNGRGTVWELPDGRWRWQITLGYRADGKRISASGTAKDKTAAELALAQAITDQARGLLSAPNKITVREYGEIWLSRQKHLRPSSRSAYTLELAYAFEQLGSKRVREVKAHHVKTALANLTDRVVTKGRGRGGPISPRTLGKILTRLRAIFREAVIDQVLYVNPCDGVRSVRRKSEAAKPLEHVGRVLDVLEAARFYEVGTALHGAGLCRLWPALFTAISIGLRRSEVMGLRWEDVDFGERIIRIRQARTKQDGKIINGPTKTSGSERDIPMPSSLHAVLEAHHERQMLERQRAEDAWLETGAVFATLQGDWTHPDNLHHALTTLIEWSDPKKFQTGSTVFLKRVPREHRAALEATITADSRLPEISPHDLRHTYATLALRRRVPIEVVSKILGHADISTTLDIYRHVLPSEVRSQMVDLFDAPAPDRRVTIQPLN